MLSLKTRFFLASFLTGALVLGFAFFLVQRQEGMRSLLTGALSRDIQAMHAAAGIKHDFVYFDDLVFRYLSTGDAQLLEESAKARRRAQLEMGELTSLSESPTVRDLLQDLDRESRDYFAEVQRLLAAAPIPEVPGEKESILNVILWARQVPARQRNLSLLSSKGRAHLVRVYSLCDKLVDVHRLKLEEVQRSLRQGLQEDRETLLRGSLVVFTGTLFLSAFAALSVLMPLGDLLKGIRRVLEGDLGVEIIPRGADEMGRIAMAFNSMARSLKENQEKLVRETITDELTGLNNFRYFQNMLAGEVARAKRYGKSLSVLVVDIDHFKKYNDAHGHPMGNLVLKGVAAALRETLRNVDLLARYGGEEFVALLPETNKEQARRAAERLREAVDACEFPGAETQPAGRITISIGGASFPEDAKVARDLLEKADKALYAAKAGGRNRTVFHESS
jgi:diguanylate cyclase (GGDEF)-like protein